jgi:hypothetical protein
MFIPTSVIILSILLAGRPDAFLDWVVTWRRRRRLYGAVLEWFGALLDAMIGAIAEMGGESFLPHHEVRDVFGPVWVADYPSAEILWIIRIGTALLGSAVLRAFQLPCLEGKERNQWEQLKAQTFSRLKSNER